jgi:hypothetical protein
MTKSYKQQEKSVKLNGKEYPVEINRCLSRNLNNQKEKRMI